MQSENSNNEVVWNPMKVFECPSDYNFALVILNAPIYLQHDLILPMWDKAQVTVTVDGGTNYWMDYLGDLSNDTLSGKCNKYLPTLVTGDMDSISPVLLDKLKHTQSKVIHTPDQMETDYTKALRQLNEYIVKNKKKLDGIHVLAENLGRLDQIIANINTLHKCDKILGKLPVLHIDATSLTWLLNPGVHKIIVPDIIRKSKSHCALIPFNGSNQSIVTTGLKWNLNKTCMRFGGLVSTSNSFSDKPEEVSITTDVQIVWTMGIKAITGSGEK